MKKVSTLLLDLVAFFAVVGLSLVPAGVALAVPASVQDGMNATGAGNQSPKNLTTDVLPTVINTMLFVVGALAVVMIIFSGIRYASSRGDPKAVEGAKNTLLYSIVGLVIAIFAYAIVNWVVVAITK